MVILSRRALGALSVLLFVGCSGGEDAASAPPVAAAHGATTADALPALTKDADTNAVFFSQSTYEMARDEAGVRYAVFQVPADDLRYLTTMMYLPGFLKSSFANYGLNESSPLAGSVGADAAFVLAHCIATKGDEVIKANGTLEVVVRLDNAFDPSGSEEREASVWVQGTAEKVKLPRG